MEYVKIQTKEDIEKLKPIFKIIFPEMTDYDFTAYYDSIEHIHNISNSLEYYFIFHNNDLVGICGMYSNNEIDGWLRWFGILPQYRHRGFARESLAYMEEFIKSKGFKVMRIYTDRVANFDACTLYSRAGFIQDGDCGNNIVTFHKALSIPESEELNWGE